MPGSSYLRSGHDRLQIGQRRLHRSSLVMETRAERVSGPDPLDTTSTDLTWYDWEESVEVASGKVPLALPAVSAGDDAKEYPSMPCAISEPQPHREKDVTVARLFNAMVSRPVGRKEMLTNPDALASMKKERSINRPGCLRP